VRRQRRCRRSLNIHRGRGGVKRREDRDSRRRAGAQAGAKDRAHKRTGRLNKKPGRYDPAGLLWQLAPPFKTGSANLL